MRHILIAVLIIASGCSGIDSKDNFEEKWPNALDVKMVSQFNGGEIMIIKIKHHNYIITQDGGIEHSASCPHNKQ